jgi:hypothetical protein
MRTQMASYYSQFGTSAYLRELVETESKRSDPKGQAERKGQ